MKHASRLSTMVVISLLLLICLASCTEPEGGGSEARISSPSPGIIATMTSLPSATPEPGVGNWVIAGDPLRGYANPPSEQFFVSMVELKQIDTKGGEFTVNMNPVVDPSCSQIFRVGWEFERDVGAVMEGDTFNITVFNEPSGGMNECYKQAKNAMVYGGEVTIELKPSGSSHFLYEDAYKHYHEGESQYLFALVDPTGAVYPDESNTPSKRSTGTMLVMDGANEIGEMDAPHGNFSFTISAGSVFAYTVTYLYDAVPDPG